MLIFHLLSRYFSIFFIITFSSFILYYTFCLFLFCYTDTYYLFYLYLYFVILYFLHTLITSFIIIIINISKPVNCSFHPKNRFLKCFIFTNSPFLNIINVKHVSTPIINVYFYFFVYLFYTSLFKFIIFHVLS